MLKECVKGRLREALSALYRGSPVIPIFAGPARGRCVPKHVGLENLSILFGRYETSVTQAILSIEREMRVVYDVGAHVGLTSLMLATKFGDAEIFAFEPAPDNLLQLEVLSAGNLGMNMTAVAAAVSEKNGVAQFHRSHASSMGLLAEVAAGDSAQAIGRDYELVRTLSLDSFVFDEAHPAPDLIKIDVEGAEGLVIAGALRTIERYRPILLIEVHGPKHAGEAWDLLLKQSYEWRYIDRRRGPAETIDERGQLIAYFGPGDRWTQHVLLT